MQKSHIVLLVVLPLVAGCTIQQDQPLIANQDIRLTILHTADIHSRLLPYDLQPNKTDRDLGLSPIAGPYGGVARLAALIKIQRKLSDRVIHLDSGDCFQGAPIFNANLGEAEIKWLSLVGADAVVIGNHEFDAGAMNLFWQVSRHATYPLLAANYKFLDPREPGVVPLAEVTQPYTILDVKGLKVGVIGMANISSLNSIVAEGNSMSVKVLEQNEALRKWVQFVEPQVDLVVVLSHLGLSEDQDLIKGYAKSVKNSVAQKFVDREMKPWKKVSDNGDGTGMYWIPGVNGVDVIMGGHIHVVLNPSQVLTDAQGRHVILQHSGAFAKYLGRLDLILHKDPTGEHGWEVKAHTYHAFPIDRLWCDPNPPTYDPTNPGPELQALATFGPQCDKEEDAQTTKLLEPYILGLNQSLDLPKIFAYTPKEILRRNSSTGGDAPLGNLTAESMQRRKRVDAEIGITNTLGIRDNLYPGPINMESMFNVFPFENTITIMYLSGREVQGLLDYVAERSAGRGCQSQAQISGLRFLMDCGQVRANDHHYQCGAPTDCPNYDPTDQNGIDWSCVQGQCYEHPAKNVRLVTFDASSGKQVETAIDPNFSYKVATNDYIAAGGSGFVMLKRNTTQFDTGISLRDALIEYMENFCTCNQLLSVAPQDVSGSFFCNGRPVDATAVRACQAIKADPGAASAGKCTCADVKAAQASNNLDGGACGHITGSMTAFCDDPMNVPVVVGIEDNRIARRVVDRSVTP